MASEAEQMEPPCRISRSILLPAPRVTLIEPRPSPTSSTMTYAELDAASARLATLLEREGIGAGDRVGVMLPNIAAAPIAYYGIWRLGAIVVPMNPLMQGREVQFYLSNTDSKALIGSLGVCRRCDRRRRARRCEAVARRRRRTVAVDRRLTRVRRAPSSVPTPTPPSCCTPREPPARRRAPS